MVAQSGQESASKWLATIPGYQRDTAANIGTRVHALAESIARNQDVSVTEAEEPYIASYRRFLVEWQPTFKAAEEMVCSLTHGYAGTLRFAAKKDTRLEVGLILVQAGDKASEDGFDCDAHLEESKGPKPALEVGSADAERVRRRPGAGQAPERGAGRAVVSGRGHDQRVEIESAFDGPGVRGVGERRIRRCERN